MILSQPNDIGSSLQSFQRYSRAYNVQYFSPWLQIRITCFHSPVIIAVIKPTKIVAAVDDNVGQYLFAIYTYIYMYVYMCRYVRFSTMKSDLLTY